MCAFTWDAIVILTHFASAAAVGQQSNEESIEFGDEDESRDDGSPGKRPKPQVRFRPIPPSP